MKAEGWKFPPVREAEAMFEADVAPDWHEGDCCHRCRVEVLGTDFLSIKYFCQFFFAKTVYLKWKKIAEIGFISLTLVHHGPEKNTSL
jgi:hypothetical protein